ncbi:type II toxin-antitoxin system PemK/MazF family toxin [Candidatus Peregrinibacteria bacterium]|nr:type II toxin-antitoxin system PemK/MazF family toxin [Candidatus Peregrinibacteria bacterium]
MKKRDIILMNAPFTDLSEKKIRPALVLAQLQDDLLICFIGSKIDKSAPHDILIKSDADNKLRVDSAIKCNKLFTLHYSLIKGVLGTVPPKIYDAVIQKIVRIIR